MPDAVAENICQMADVLGRPAGDPVSMHGFQTRWVTAALGAISLVIASGSPAQANVRPGNRVVGRWGGVVPCIPAAFDPGSGNVTCVGSTSWVGDLTGQTHYTFTGSIDLTTGAGSGTIDETFVGRDSRGRTGSLHFLESVVSTPTGLPGTGSVTIEARVVDGGGEFAGAQGVLVFEGIVNAVAGDLGTYAGRLRAPHP